MMTPLSHEEARALFQPWVDSELPAPAEASLHGHLSECADCRIGWEEYSGLVSGLRELPEPPVPRELASQILKRARRRRPALRALQLTWAYRVPVELLVPLLIAAAIACWFSLSRP